MVTTRHIFNACITHQDFCLTFYIPLYFFYLDLFVLSWQNSNRCSVYSVNGGAARVLGPKSQWAEVGVDNPVFAGDLDATAWNPSLKESIISSSQVRKTT